MRGGDVTCAFCDLPENEPLLILSENGQGYIIKARGYEDGSRLLVIPRRHAESFREMTPGAPALMLLIERACEMVRKMTGVQSVSVSLNYGVDAGQTVKHSHWWAIARPAGEPASGLGMSTLLEKYNG